MENVKRNTDKKCSACKGKIIEQFSFHSKRIGPLIVGGRNPTSKWIVSEFSCEQCGMLFKPTPTNGLAYFDKKKIEKAMHNAYPIELCRDVHWNEIITLGKKTKAKNSLLVTDRVIGRYEEHHNFHVHHRTHAVNLNYLIIKPGKQTILLNPSAHQAKKLRERNDAIVKKAQQMAKDVSLEAATNFIKRRIKSAKWEGKLKAFSTPFSLFPDLSKIRIPKGAVPAVLVEKCDNDFNCTSYYIPEDAIRVKKD